MAICSDLGRVFEIGPVFRAEVGGSMFKFGATNNHQTIQPVDWINSNNTHSLISPPLPSFLLQSRTRTRTATCASSRGWTWR